MCKTEPFPKGASKFSAAVVVGAKRPRANRIIVRFWATSGAQDELSRPERRRIQRPANCAVLATAVCSLRLFGRRRAWRAHGRATCGSAAAASTDLIERRSLVIVIPFFRPPPCGACEDLMPICGNDWSKSGNHCGSAARLSAMRTQSLKPDRRDQAAVVGLAGMGGAAVGEEPVGLGIGAGADPAGCPTPADAGGADKAGRSKCSRSPCPGAKKRL